MRPDHVARAARFALLALLLGAGLRRDELARLRIEDFAERGGRWCVVDLVGKDGRVRTVAVPGWAQRACDEWIAAMRSRVDCSSAR